MAGRFGRCGLVSGGGWLLVGALVVRLRRGRVLGVGVLRLVADGARVSVGNPRR